MFKDVVRIKVIGGKGGDGCVSFRREKYVPKGGPDGGDGGRGGSCIIAVNAHLSTLSHITDGQIFKAENGKPGSGRKRHGADGKDVVIEVPRGTQVIDARTGKIIADLTDVTRIVVARGGRGGLGNWHFRSPTNQTPTQATKGKPGEEREIILNLKLIADVGLVGYPNVGKSSIIRKLTRATPKVANYPFTTTEPVLGVITVSEKEVKHFSNPTLLKEWNRKIIIADIPGIIENAHLGVGLGLEFLKHIERTKFLVLVLDITDEPEKKAKIVLDELSQYNRDLLNRVKLVVLNKSDLLEEDEKKNINDRVSAIEKHLTTRGKHRFVITSALTGEGIEKLREKIIEEYVDLNFSTL